MDTTREIVRRGPRRFSDAGAAVRAAAAAEAAHLAAASALARAGVIGRDQSFPEETWALAPARTVAPPLLLLGGMGPLAGLRAFAAACLIPAPPRGIVLVQACAVPDRTRAVRLDRAGGRGGREARGAVVRALDAALDRAWRTAGRPERADLMLVCNTAHHFLGGLRLPPGVRPASLIAAAVRRCRGLSRVRVLATAGTRASGLYARDLAAEGVDCLSLSPGEEAALTDLIYRGAKAGRLNAAAAGLDRLLEHLARIGPAADALVCGCTEIPLLLPLLRAPPPWPPIDPLACALVDLARDADRRPDLRW